MKTQAVIEIFYFDGCPNHERLLARLPSLLRRHQITAEIVPHEIPDADSAQRERFLGSPSIRVAGRDVEPGADDRRDYGLKCRIYHTPTGLAGLPTDAWILDAIAAHTPTTAADTERRAR
jgi:hypothetical protein